MQESKTYRAHTEDGTRLDVTITPPDERQLIMQYNGTLQDHDELRQLQQSGRQRLPAHSLRKEANFVAPASLGPNGELRWDHSGGFMKHGSLRLEKMGGHPAMGADSTYFRAGKKYAAEVVVRFDEITPNWINFFQLYGLHGGTHLDQLLKREQLALFVNVKNGDYRYSLLVRDHEGEPHLYDLGRVVLGLAATFSLTWIAGDFNGGYCHVELVGKSKVRHKGPIGTGQDVDGVAGNYLVQSFGPYSSSPCKCEVAQVSYYHFGD